MRDPFEQLKRLELADLRRQDREERRWRRLAARAEQRQRRRELWPRWVAFWETAARHLKTAGIVMGSTVAVISGGIALYTYADTAWHKLRRAWSFYADRGVGEADRPRGSDVASLATDRFEREHPPDAGTTK